MIRKKSKMASRLDVEQTAIQLWRSTNITTMVKLEMLWLWKIYLNDKMFQSIKRVNDSKDSKDLLFQNRLRFRRSCQSFVAAHGHRLGWSCFLISMSVRYL